MGLFGKKKEADVPPAPPMPSPSVMSESGPAPVMTSAPPLNSYPSPPVFPANSTLSAPPVPGGNLEEIKSQVSAGYGSSENQVSMQRPSGSSSMGQDSSEEDSLFDFSELQFPDDDASTGSSSQASLGSGGGVSSGGDVVSSPSRISSDSSGYSREITGSATDIPEGTTETSFAYPHDMNFINNKKYVDKKPASGDIIYITTQQFKMLMETVEDVKARVKDSSERHLRLLDMKAEEDVEFENLRKDFQYIEDKLYEVDSIIFDK